MRGLPVAFLLPLLGALLLAPAAAVAQDTDMLLNTDIYHYMDRIDIRGYADTTVHTDIKPYGRKSLSAVLRRADTSQMGLRERQWHTRMRILADDEFANSKTSAGLLAKVPFVYNNGRDFLAVKTRDFELYANPSIQFGLGRDKNNAYAGRDTTMDLLANSRGVSLRGSLYGKVGFYTELYDNQFKLAQFAGGRLDTVPGSQYQMMFGEVFVKKFKNAPNSADFFTSRGYITFSPLPCTRIKWARTGASGAMATRVWCSRTMPPIIFL